MNDKINSSLFTTVDYVNEWKKFQNKSAKELFEYLLKEGDINDSTIDVSTVIELLKKKLDIPYEFLSYKRTLDDWHADGWPDHELIEVNEKLEKELTA